MILIGRKKILSTGRITPYSIVNTTLAMRSVSQLLKLTVGSTQAKTNNVIAVRIIGRNIAKVYRIYSCSTMARVALR